MKTPKNTSEAVTPLMRQYLSIRDEIGDDAVLFFRMGDFYELFFADAERAAETLDLALVRRGKHKGQPIPMVGIPVHSSSVYIGRLSEAGVKVAICEETEAPSEARKRGRNTVTRRAVLRIVSPETETTPQQTNEGKAEKWKP